MVNRDRAAVIGLKGGADHPFGAVLLVATPDGLVMVDEYLERQQAAAVHCAAIQQRFNTAQFADVRWGVSDLERELQLEFSLAGVPIMGVPNADTYGIQRVQTWLAAKQLFFIKSRVPEALRQLGKYRFADNTLPDGQKRVTEAIFRSDDELPKALAVAVLTWPELPKVPESPLSAREQKRWDALDEKSKQDIERLREYGHAETEEATLGTFFSGGTGKGDRFW